MHHGTYCPAGLTPDQLGHQRRKSNQSPTAPTPDSASHGVGAHRNPRFLLIESRARGRAPWEG